MSKRPVNLNLLSMRFPITALVSIAHRVSGVLLFLALPLMVWALQAVLGSQADYQCLKDCFSGLGMQMLLWAIMVATGYHILAGIRHLLMDMHAIPMSFKSGSMSAYVLVVLAIVWAVVVGGWIW